jgi:NADPH:quinone reductase-like Zn-dependent oxidoreductase
VDVLVGVKRRDNNHRYGLGQLVDAGRLRAIVDTIRPLSGAASALCAVETGHSRGKTVLVIDHGPVSN